MVKVCSSSTSSSTSDSSSASSSVSSSYSTSGSASVSSTSSTTSVCSSTTSGCSVESSGADNIPSICEAASVTVRFPLSDTSEVMVSSFIFLSLCHLGVAFPYRLNAYIIFHALLLISSSFAIDSKRAMSSLITFILM